MYGSPLTNFIYLRPCYQHFIVRNFLAFFKFLFSGKFFLHAVLIILTVALMIFGCLELLKKYTHHGEEITVPNLIGMSKNGLSALLESENLRLVILDSTFVLNKEKGIVLGQNPKPLSKVKMNRTIYISVNAMQYR